MRRSTLWCPFNSLLNSSTRTEPAAAIVAIIPPVPFHTRIDNAAVVGKGSQIIRDYDEEEKMKRRGEGKTKKLGGTSSRLRQSTPFRKPWRLMHDGDLWEMFAKAAEARGPGCTNISKAKGHATQEMVGEGKVHKKEKKGNDQADTGEETGTVTMQIVTQTLADIYSWRHGGYRNLMVRIQRGSL